MHRKIRWILLTVLAFFIAMSAERLYILFTSGYLHGLNNNLLKALWLGVRYDLRELGVLAVVMLLLGSIPFLSPFRSSAGKKFWLSLLSILSVLLVFISVVDVLYFDYLSERLNASVLNFLSEGETSGMVWQTYPVFRLLLLIAVLSALLIYAIQQVYKIAASGAVTRGKRNVIQSILLFLVAGFCIFGQINQYPLRWSDAFKLGDNRLSQLALNPFQSFFSSFAFRNVSYDKAAVKKYYPLMAQYLGVDIHNDAQPDYARYINDTPTNRPNVILVICESFSAYKSSMWGNPLNTTPFFDSLCHEGVFFDHCFTPHFGTARGVWATVTGIPDVLLEKTASRNPLIVDQHSIIDDFKGYKREYFIGGSTSWANIRGLLENNIKDIHIHEKSSYDAKGVDVWGISDKDLFMEANKTLSTEATPFFAVIQTADNHRPYTIPDKDKNEFKIVSYPKDTLIKYGFQSDDELNAFRYTDFSYKKFIEAAKKEPYFNNTVFVFVGDHGIRGNAGDMFPRAWTDNALTCFHVPLLFYAPAFLKPARHSMIASQVDILPTVAGIAKIPYHDATLGHDLLHLKDTTTNTAFYIDHDIRNIGVVHGNYMLEHQLLNGTETLVPIDNNRKIPADSAAVISAYMHDLTMGFYETAKYMLFNNHKAK